MELTLTRSEFTDISTISELRIDGTFFCYTIEDKDRGLKDTDSILYIKGAKIYGKTAIPKGKYNVVLSMSNRFKRLLPEIQNVKGFDGVRIHRGNTAEDTLGCLIVGYKKSVNSVYESTKAEIDLVEILKKADKIELEIK